MATGRIDVSRIRGVHGVGLSRGIDGQVRDVRSVGWKCGAREVVRGLDVRSGYSCKDEVVGGPCGLLGRSEHVVGGDFEDGEILQIDGEFHLPSEKKRKFSSITLDKEEKKGELLLKDCVTEAAPCFVLDGDLVDDPVVENRSVALESQLVSAQSYQVSHGSVLDDVQGPNREELVEPRNAYMSRWASDEDDVPGDKEEILHGTRSQSTESDCRDSSVVFSGADEDSESELDNQDPIDKSKEMLSDRSTDSSQRSVDTCQGCRGIFEYKRLNEISEGTYGKVYRARDKMTGEIVALKKVKMSADMVEYGFPMTALREINLLNSLYHPNIVNVKEVVMGDLDSIFMVMECMDHDLKGVMEVMRQPFCTSDVKCLMLQLLEGVKYLHDNWVLHRDLKTSNILLNNNGELKICDFGMSRNYGSPLKPYTPLVVTLWYRAPELLLGAKKYSTSLDMWSVGCIMAELLAKTPLFAGKNEIDQLAKIFRMLGTPNETTWPGFSALPGAKAKFVQQPYNLLRKKFPVASFMGSPVLSRLGLDLLTKLLAYDPEKRITADDALNHPWFHEVPLPKAKEFLPTFPPQSARARIRDAKKKMPNSKASLVETIVHHCYILPFYLVKQIGARRGIKILLMIPHFIMQKVVMPSFSSAIDLFSLFGFYEYCYTYLRFQCNRIFFSLFRVAIYCSLLCPTFKCKWELVLRREKHNVVPPVSRSLLE